MNKTKNLVSATLSEASCDKIQEMIKKIESELPFLIALSTAEKRRIRPSGPRTAAFVDMALRGAQNFPQHLLQTFDVDEFEHDVLLMHRLKGLRASVASLLEKLDDTIYASSADALAEANEVYGYLKKASRFEGSLKTVVKEIGQRYARPSRRKNVADDE